MNKTIAPTKGNLMAAKNTLRLSKQGYEMLDKKRNILIREMMLLIDQAKDVQDKIESTFAAAYRALGTANLVMGVDHVQDIMHMVMLEDSVEIKQRSVMGVVIPMVRCAPDDGTLKYSLYATHSALDEAVLKFSEVKQLTVRLAEIENAVYRLAMNIKKTQKRANALKNITIPLYETITKEISGSLEEKEREEHTRLKIIKKNKG
ncbi:MAG TPA: V-type ATP synthase subunit D [Candidatus Avimonoglobus intestinipullorum]|uniref:V-type ATP synthase subunit D n=1 Tax=Candidatus Avimonoglobus intestinipullorum TaxID=2840699 RepID=A0A9D1S6C7_9FIRM|nr:V-type ATP synthase subunit D [Candidatus Avimonoglobus intestinipullorum]